MTMESFMLSLALGLKSSAGKFEWISSPVAKMEAKLPDIADFLANQV